MSLLLVEDSLRPLAVRIGECVAYALGREHVTLGIAQVKAGMWCEFLGKGQLSLRDLWHIATDFDWNCRAALHYCKVTPLRTRKTISGMYTGTYNRWYEDSYQRANEALRGEERGHTRDN